MVILSINNGHFGHDFFELTVILVRLKWPLFKKRKITVILVQYHGHFGGSSLKWTVLGRLKLDGHESNLMVQKTSSGPEPSISTLRFIPTTVHFGSKHRSLSSLTLHFGSRPSIFARPFTLRTVHFHPFWPSTLDLTRDNRKYTILSDCYFSYI